MIQSLREDDVFRQSIIAALRHFSSDLKINDELITAVDGRLLVTVASGKIYGFSIHELILKNVDHAVLQKSSGGHASGHHLILHHSDGQEGVSDIVVYHCYVNVNAHN